jgi:Family of unknown function (DUF6166)
MMRCGADMTDTTTLTRAATQRYVGVADWWGVHVWVEEGGTRRALPYRGEVPLAGFAWGRAGLGARELARSLIEHATGSPALAERHCRDMTHDVVAQLPDLGFELDRDDVIGWLERTGEPVPARKATTGIDPV